LDADNVSGDTDWAAIAIGSKNAHRISVGRFMVVVSVTYEQELVDRFSLLNFFKSVEPGRISKELQEASYIDSVRWQLSTNKYYQKRFIKTDTLLSTQHVYDVVDTVDKKTNPRFKYIRRYFLFYRNGLVLESDHATQNPEKDTIHTFTDDLKFACCHGWKVGSYMVSNDTVSFATKSGEMPHWSYYKAKVLPQGIEIFEERNGKRADSSLRLFQLRSDVVVVKSIKLR
jgi:hypothetical protein